MTALPLVLASLWEGLGRRAGGSGRLGAACWRVRGLCGRGEGAGGGGLVVVVGSGMRQWEQEDAVVMVEEEEVLDGDVLGLRGWRLRMRLGMR